MRQIFLLTGNSSTLSNSFSHPFSLEGGNYFLGLSSFVSRNTFPNITNKNNLFDYYDGERYQTIRIPEGYYNIEQLEKYLRSQIGEENISITPNDETFQLDIICKYLINFGGENSVGSFLGFKKYSLIPNKLTSSQTFMGVDPLKTIRIHCNIIRGYYINGRETHVLYSFAPSISYGYKIIENPVNIMYSPVNQNIINKIKLTVTDENNVLVDFKNEPVEIKLELRKF